MPTLSEESYNKIIQTYLSGVSQKETGKICGIGRDAVGNILKRFNIPTREYTGERDSNKKWYWNTEYFNQRTSEVAYWAGFMMADGSLSDTGRSHSLVFYLQEKDRNQLELFCNHINLPTEAIYTMNVNKKENEQYHYGVKLNYKGLPEQMLYWGIVPRKTYNFVEPQVTDELLPHYLRGWADGDGHIYAFGTGARFTVSGNKDALQWYAEALKRIGYKGNVGYTPRTDMNGVLYIGGSEQVSIVCALLQVTDNIKLERKWNVTHDNQLKKEIRVCRFCGKDVLIPVCYGDERGFYCDKTCCDNAQKRPVVDGKSQCYTCKEWIKVEDFSANDSYCKPCWNKYTREYEKLRRLKKAQSKLL